MWLEEKPSVVLRPRRTEEHARGLVQVLMLFLTRGMGGAGAVSNTGWCWHCFWRGGLVLVLAHASHRAQAMECSRGTSLSAAPAMIVQGDANAGAACRKPQSS